MKVWCTKISGKDLMKDNEDDGHWTSEIGNAIECKATSLYAGQPNDSYHLVFNSKTLDALRSELTSNEKKHLLQSSSIWEAVSISSSNLSRVARFPPTIVFLSCPPSF